MGDSNAGASHKAVFRARSPRMFLSLSRLLFKDFGLNATLLLRDGELTGYPAVWHY